MQRRGVHCVRAALLDDAQFVALEGERVIWVGFGHHGQRGQLTRPPAPQEMIQRGGLQLLVHQLHRLWCRDRPSAREAAQQDTRTEEVIEVSV
ncbi:MAG: hypothetical protein QOD36_1263, partial [Mycobacterium sp.]|nr:hypothetical protein [Mycobacterium sp.]